MVFMPTGRFLTVFKFTSMSLGLCAYLEIFNLTHMKAGHDELQARQRQEAIAGAQL